MFKLFCAAILRCPLFFSPSPVSLPALFLQPDFRPFPFGSFPSKFLPQYWPPDALLLSLAKTFHLERFLIGPPRPMTELVISLYCLVCVGEPPRPPIIPSFLCSWRPPLPCQEGCASCSPPPVFGPPGIRWLFARRWWHAVPGRTLADWLSRAAPSFSVKHFLLLKDGLKSFFPIAVGLFLSGV